MKVLAISVGNSRVQLGSYVDERLIERRAIDCADDAAIGEAVEFLWGGLENGEDEGEAVVMIASVNEEAGERIAALAGEKTGVGVIAMERDVQVPVGRRLDREAIVGQDRLLNAAAAFDRLKSACIVVDAGTAVTVDFVDGEGTFHGGAIMPGVKMGLRALQEWTSALPLVEAGEPQEAIGHSTSEAMRSGAYHGVRGAVRELVEKYAEVYGAYPKVIATGGDAEMLFSGYELIEVIVADLTLMGMVVARRHMVERAEEE